MNNLEESTKLAKETQWATLGRAIADAMACGRSIEHLIEQAEILRRIEQQSADRETQFAALARQIGDAARKGRNPAPLLERLRQLRHFELTGEVGSLGTDAS